MTTSANLFTIRRLLGLVVAVIVVITAKQSPAYASPKGQQDECEAIVTHALDVLQDVCSTVDRNKACYGNNQILTVFNGEFNSDSNPKFQDPGDQVSIKAIRTLMTQKLDVDTGTWGLSLLKLQADLPDTMPGQNVTFLVYGDTSINNASGDMQVFYFSSGLGQPTCTEIPADGILVQSPNHTQVSFTANGVNITIASTIFMRASPDQSMDILLIEGHATVSTLMGTQTLAPGQVVSVPMGGKSTLNPVGPPTLPSVAPDDKGAMAKLIAVAKKLNPPDGDNGNKDKDKNKNKGNHGNGNGSGNANDNANNGSGGKGSGK